jgi:hypothetical protein
MAPSKQISALSSLLVGVACAFCTIIVHALILGVIVTEVRRDRIAIELMRLESERQNGRSLIET